MAYAMPACAQVATPPIANSSTAPAADVNPAVDTSGLADIVVTAQRKSESLQKTAITIQVLSPATLANAGVSAPSQLVSVLPSVQIGYSGPSTSVYIRGVGGFSSVAFTSPAVPYYIDGIYVARTQSVTSELYDVERVEAIKGPQGTLYGRNASGGAINILTKRPSLTEVTGQAQLELGNYGNQTFEAGLNVPLSDTIAVRASGTIVDKGGFTSVGFGDDKHQSGRVKLLWEPNPDVSLLLNGSYGHIGGQAPAVVATNRGIPGWYPWLDISDPRSQAFATANAVAPPPIVRPTQPSDAFQDLSFYNFSAQLDWKIGATTLTVIPAYRDSKMLYRGLVGFVFDNGGLGTLPQRPETSKATSVEARLAGTSGRLDWLAGLYYSNEDQFEQYSINGGFIQRPGVIMTLVNRSYAAFTQSTFSFTDHVRLIVGGRYTSDLRSLSDGQTYEISPAVFLGPPPPAAIACTLPTPTRPQCLVETYAGRKTFRNFSWKLGVEADVFDNSLAYATASRGFKAGGFNTQSAAGTPGQAQLFKPETLTAYEVGLKSRFLNNRLQLNVSGFYWDYKNHQEPVLTYTNVPGVTNLVYQNAGAAEIYGATLDLITRPWQGATVSGSVEYAHSKYTEYKVTIPTFSYNPAANGCRVAASDPANTTLDCSGFQVARTPELSGSLGLTQEASLGSGTLSGNVNLTFASARWIGVDFIPDGRAKGYGKLDASLTYRPSGNRFSVTGFVRNITDAAIYSDGARNPFSPLFYAAIQPPRTYGARFGVTF